jgi:hypothetical protein
MPTYLILFILFFSRRKEDWGPQEKTRLPERIGPQDATGLPEKMDYLDTIGKAYGKTEKEKRSLDLVHIHGPASWKVSQAYYIITALIYMKPISLQ